ncbi:YaiI/YqxD family protein [Rhodopirellula sp. MGV]|uniref:YaiI/YqxD family protein n=1 Tax=Rhodopirellula sp. MGV TaxID=2023130 RepID=UPI001E488C04|nr:YaiI/YqxD family protein [Rhodopirellula sp. MGV]
MTDEPSDSEQTPPAPTIWIDADACPVMVKELVYRAADRRQIPVVVVANQSIPIPKSAFVRRVTVRDGADMADHAIVAASKAGDLVIADDVPLAARVIENGVLVITSRGELYNERNIHNRLATRDLMEQLRLSGVETGGPKAFGKKDAQAFANQLDRTLTKLLKRSAR